MKLISNIIFIISVLLSIYYIYIHISPFNISKIILGMVSIILLIIPTVIEKISKIKIEKFIKLIYYFFLFVAFLLGGLFQLYYSTSFFDLLVHFLFGFLLSIIINTKVNIKSWKNILLIISIIISISFIWESLEFSSDVLLKTDHQEKISGARDTMTDILISIVGAITFVFYIKLLNKIKEYFA